MGNYQRFVNELVDAAGVDASANYELGSDLENTAAIAIHAKWTETSVTGTIQVQASIDGSNWYGLNTAVNVDTAAEMWFEDADIAYPYIRVALAIAAGELTTLKILVAGKG